MTVKKKTPIDLSRTMQKATETVSETKAIIDSVEKKKERTIQKTTFFDDEADFRLNAVKKIINKGLPVGEKVTMSDLISDAVMEYLDAHYPQTKEMYEQMK